MSAATLALLVGLYVVMLVVFLVVHHRLMARRTPGKWWADMDGPPPNVRILDRRGKR